MQILLVTFQNKGGMVQYASQLANALATSADVIQVIGSGVDRALFSSEVDVREYDFPSSIKECDSALVSQLWSIRNLILESDVTHLTIRNPIFLPLIPTLYRTNFAFTIHDVEPHTGEYKLRGEITDNLMVKSSDTVFVHGEYGVRQFRNKYGRSPRVEKLTHGDYSFFRDYCPDDEANYRPELLFFGRIRPYKGIDVLLEAEKLIAESFDGEYQITIAGRGPLNDRSREYIESTDTVSLRNEYIPNDDVCELFNRCRGVLLPYRDATQTGVIPIAYSFQKPVVASSVGGIPEVVEDGSTGYLVEPEDPKALANRCINLLESDSKAREMGDRGDEFRRQYMRWDDIARTVLSVYGSIQ